MERRRARVRAVDGVLAAMDEDRCNRRARVLATDPPGGVIDDLGGGEDARPATQHEAAVPLADPDRVRRAVGDVGDTNLAVPVERAVEGLPLVATTKWVGVILDPAA